QPKYPHKVRVTLSKKQVVETQHVEVKVATADTTKSLKASELAKEQGNRPLTAEAKKEPEKIIEMEEDAEDHSMEIPTIEQLLDEVVKETSGIPYAQTEYESMYEDYLRYISGFEDADYDDTQGNDVSHSDHTFPNHNASAERLSLPDHLDHICEEVSSLHSKLGGKIRIRRPKDPNPANTREEPQSAEPLVESQGEQPANLDIVNKEPAPPASIAKLNEGKKLVVHKLKDKNLEGIKSVEDDSDEDNKQPVSKRIKIMTLISDIPDPTPLNTFVPEHLLKPKEQQKSIQEFTDQLFKTTSSRFSPTSLRELTPPRDSYKGKAITIIKEPGNKLVKYQKEGGSNPLMPKLKSFITSEGPLSQEEYNNQIREMKRLKDLKAEQEKSEHELRKADTLPITKISYVVNSKKEATIKITRGDNSLNLVVYPNFKLKTLSFSKWLEVHALAKRLRIPPPPEFATFGLTVEEPKKKTIEFIKEVFVTKNVRVDGMDMNLIPPSRIMLIQGVVINETESRIFFMNGNTDMGFQRESEFHLTLTIELIRLYNQIKVDSEIVREMFLKMNYVIEARSDCIKDREIVEKNLDNVG
nr:hypothetical protein [Tanacetum cinerariifolium]